jgi:protein phosphatase
VRNGQIEQLTFDHSLQWEMIRLGRATPENVELFHPRNVITRCLGPDPHVQIDIEGPFTVEAGDFFLLCSDGLTNHVSDAEIGQIVESMPPTDSSRLLINLANCRGGSDNSTVIVISIESYPTPSSSGIVKNSDRVSRVRTTEMTYFGNSKAWGIIIGFVAILCVIASITLGIIGNTPAAVVLAAASVFAWLISKRTKNRLLHASSNLAETDIDPLPQLNAASQMESGNESDRHMTGLEKSSVSRAAFLPSSPYRIVDSTLSESLLLHLAEVQSDLVQAARDSGWKVDFDELTNLNRQAVQAQQSQKLDRSIKSRGKAIDLLMRELYQRSRAD